MKAELWFGTQNRQFFVLWNGHFASHILLGSVFWNLFYKLCVLKGFPLTLSSEYYLLRDGTLSNFLQKISVPVLLCFSVSRWLSRCCVETPSACGTTRHLRTHSIHHHKTSAAETSSFATKPFLHTARFCNAVPYSCYLPCHLISIAYRPTLCKRQWHKIRSSSQCV